jgi:hypothetical protein
MLHAEFSNSGPLPTSRLPIETACTPSNRSQGEDEAIKATPCLRESRACLQHDLRHSVSCSFRALSFRERFFLLIGMTGAIGSSFSIAPMEIVKGKRYRLPPMMAVIVAGSSGGVGNAITGFFLVVILALVMFTARLGGFSMTAGFFFIRAPAFDPSTDS